METINTILQSPIPLGGALMLLFMFGTGFVLMSRGMRTDKTNRR